MTEEPIEEFSEESSIDERLAPLLESSESDEEIAEPSYCPSEERLELPRSRLKLKRDAKVTEKAEVELKIKVEPKVETKVKTKVKRKRIRKSKRKPVDQLLRTPWSKEENETMMEGLKRHGSRSYLIKEMLPHRSFNAIRSRINDLKVKHANKKRVVEDQDLAPVLESVVFVRWSTAEKEAFKKAIVQYGPKPAIICKVFPTRSVASLSKMIR